VIKQEAGVKGYDSEAPPSVGLRAGAFAQLGTLILTDRRLLYILKGGGAFAAAWVVVNPLAAWAIEKQVSRAEVDDLARRKGSYCVPLQDITNVATARHMASGYLRVDNCTPGQKPAHSYILGSGWSKNEDWVVAINAARANLARAPFRMQSQFQQAVPVTNMPTQFMQGGSSGPTLPPPPPPPPNAFPLSSPRYCGSCGAHLQPNTRFCEQCGTRINP
jgi:hypothetical protein